MIEQYQPPKHWWQREKKILITIYPAWLAQRLCKHNEIVIQGKSKDKTFGVCLECYKRIEFINGKQELLDLVDRNGEVRYCT